MTQEVQPLAWQKRTNLEEHQQFFSKINEIIANLAPTVGEAEQAIASANAAIATANAASQQAQTAANTVAGYNTRLITVEDEASSNTSNITDLQDRMGTAEGNIASLGTRMSNAESKNSQQDTVIAALQTADGQNVKINSINEYAVGLTGNQENISGVKGFVETIRGRVTDVLYAEYSGALSDGKYRQFAKISSANSNSMIVLDVMISANGANYGFGRVMIGNPTTTEWFCKWVYRKSNSWLDANIIQIAKETATGDLMIFAKNPTITGLSINLVYSKNGPDIQGTPRVEKVTNATDYSLDGSDAGVENIVPGSDMP